MRLKPFELERFFAKYEFNVPFMLSASDSETLCISDLLDLENNAKEDFLNLELGYTESSGHPELKNQITRLYRNQDPQNILVHTGAEEAIFNFMCSCLGKDDEVIVQWPCYQSLAQVAESIGCKVKKWCLRPENLWQPDIDDLKKMISEKTRVLVINFPHNPTGAMLGPSLANELNELSQKYGFIIFSDEVYRFLEYDSKARIPAFCDLNPNAVSLGVMSKAFGLPGLRIGWIATKNSNILQAMASFKDYTTICNSAPSEFLAICGLKHHEYLSQRLLKIIKYNLVILDEFFSRYNSYFEFNPPKAGPISFVRYLKSEGAQAFCEELAKKAGVLLLPGTCYGKEFKDYFRIGFGRENMPQALKTLDNWLSK